jgi:putative DNA primase/helicase
LSLGPRGDAGTTVREADRAERATGYSLTGHTGEQVALFQWGAGANGKTTENEVKRRLLGDYAQQTPADTFLERRSDAIPNDLARLRGARLVSTVESGEGRRLDETLVKHATGGDMIAARFLWREWFEFRPEFKLWWSTDHKPEIRGTDALQDVRRVG